MSPLARGEGEAHAHQSAASSFLTYFSSIEQHKRRSIDSHAMASADTHMSTAEAASSEGAGATAAASDINFGAIEKVTHAAAQHPSRSQQWSDCTDACAHSHSVALLVSVTQLHAAPVIPLYHLENYTFGTKEPQHEKDATVKMRMDRQERVRQTHRGNALRAAAERRERRERSCLRWTQRAPLFVHCSSSAPPELSQPRHASQCGRHSARAQSRTPAHSAAADRIVILQAVRSTPCSFLALPERRVHWLMWFPRSLCSRWFVLARSFPPPRAVPVVAFVRARMRCLV